MNTLLGGSPFTLSYAQADAAVKQNERTPHPLAKYSYFDKSEFGCSGGCRKAERSGCGNIAAAAAASTWGGNASAGTAYRMHLQLYQPDDEALQYLATLDGVLLELC